MDRRILAAAATVLAVTSIGLLSASDIGSENSGELSRSDISVEVEDLMLHRQERGDNDVLANLSLTLSDTSPEGAAVRYMKCTDCTMGESIVVLDPGETETVLYEYNWQNQTEFIIREEQYLEYIGTGNISDQELEGGILALGTHIENQSEIKRLDLDLPNHREVEDTALETYTR